MPAAAANSKPNRVRRNPEPAAARWRIAPALPLWQVAEKLSIGGQSFETLAPQDEGFL
jgi:hypothetical protein